MTWAESIKVLVSHHGVCEREALDVTWADSKLWCHTMGPETGTNGTPVINLRDWSIKT